VASQVIVMPAAVFQAVGLLTAKLRCPFVVWAHGNSRVPVVANRRCCRPEVAVAGMHIKSLVMNTLPDHLEGRLEDHSLTYRQPM